MNKKFLRSVIAISSGWIVSFAFYIITMIVIALFNQETFKPGVQLSVEWLLITLIISSIYQIIGGFVTAAIAQRSEIKHTIGLILVTLSTSLYFIFTAENTTPLPNWYIIAGLVSDILSILFGGWLRIKQKILLEKRSQGMIRTMRGLRFFAAICLSFITFVTISILGTVFGGIGFLIILQKFFGEDYQGIVFLPMFIISIFLSFKLSLYIYMKISGENISPMDSTR